MDRQRNQEEITTVTVSYQTILRMSIHYVSMAYFVLITSVMNVPKPIVLLEGVYFAVAYYLPTLDAYGACLVIVGHVLTLLGIVTNSRMFSVLVLTTLSTIYPIFSIYANMMLLFRLVMYTSSLKILFTTDRAEGFHIFLLLIFISYYYSVHFTHRSHEDRVMYGVVLWTVCFLPDISRPMACILFMAVCLWIENKGLRFPPLRTFPVRPLDSEHFFR